MAEPQKVTGCPLSFVSKHIRRGLTGGWGVGAVQGKGAQAAGSTAVWRSLTSKVHSRTCESVKGHRVRTRPGKSDGIVAKPSTRWKGETHRIQAGSVESHSGLFMRLSCPQASWRCWFALSARLGSLSRNYTANCVAEQNTWLAILTWNGESRRKKRASRPNTKPNNTDDLKAVAKATWTPRQADWLNVSMQKKTQAIESASKNAMPRVAIFQSNRLSLRWPPWGFHSNV